LNFLASFDAGNAADDHPSAWARFHELTNAPGEGEEDKRIKVAILDNGADRIRGAAKDQMAKGVSYVTADPANPNQTLPWWMVADPHGTQMASLVAQVNPYCRLYIARVGKARYDILPDDAAEVCIHVRYGGTNL
jgi:hypothetical protein